MQRVDGGVKMGDQRGRRKPCLDSRQMYSTCEEGLLMAPKHRKRETDRRTRTVLDVEFEWWTAARKTRGPRDGLSFERPVASLAGLPIRYQRTESGIES